MRRVASKTAAATACVHSVVVKRPALHVTRGHSYLVQMARPHRLRTANLEKLHKARWYMAHGYPLTVIAERVGVHRNTVREWAKLTGYFATGADGLNRAETRTVNNILRLFSRLSPEARSAALSRLTEDGAA